MKKGSICIAIAVIFSIIFSLVLGVYFSSGDNIENKTSNFENHIFDTENMVFEGWHQDKNEYISLTENSSITIVDINSYVNTIHIDGYIGEVDDLKAKVFFTNSPNEIFSESKCFESNIYSKGQNLFIDIKEDVYSIKLQLFDSPQMRVKLNSIETNPTFFIFSFGVIFSIFTILICVVIAISMIIFRKNVSAYINSTIKYKSLLSNLIKRDLKVKYRRSALGILWSVLNPLLMMLVISAVFANVFKFDIKDFPIYYITGAWIFNFVSEATSTSLTSILGASALIKKVYIPKHIFPLEKCLFSFVNMLFSLIAVAIVYAIFGVKLHFTILLFPVIMIYALIFSIGLSLILSAYNVFFRDIGHLYAVWITAWMYFTPIIYPISALPAVMVKFIKINPLYYYVEYARDVLIYGKIPTLEQNIICIGFAVIALAVGVLIFKKKQDKFILYI